MNQRYQNAKKRNKYEFQRHNTPGYVEDFSALLTERANPDAAELDTKSALEIARIINAEDQRVPKAIAKALPKIAHAIDMVACAFGGGGRLIYVGTGTSGRLGALDASECPPTFDCDPKMVQYVIAGGDKALSHSAEAHEDSPALGRADLARRKPNKKDVVCGVAASGRTPYTVAALEYARSRGAKTIAVTANADSEIEHAADIAIVVPVGPEIIAGSTRMKAGTMQKLVLNTITTGAFARMGYVFGNLMVNLRLKNKKQIERGIRILEQITNCDRQSAIDALENANRNMPVALVMLKTGVSSKEARQRLKAAKGRVKTAIKKRQ